MPQPVVLETKLKGLRRISRGKVRDIYECGENLLIVATDRLSAFDVVLPTGIPRKGQVLTAMTLFWLDFLKDVTPNHLITADVSRMGPEAAANADALAGRSMLARKARVFPIECIVRGYLAGSAWKEYCKSGTVCGEPMPKGMRESDKLPEPLFTPSTKSASGHDENISYHQMMGTVGPHVTQALHDRSIEVYRRAAEYAATRGIIICDTKFEWGQWREEILLVDEVLTPDSSRFWPAESYAPGRPQPSFDKQYVRDWLTQSGWNMTPPAPELPPDVVRRTSEKYLKAYEILTGRRLAV